MRKVLQNMLLKMLHQVVAEGNAWWYEKGFTDGAKLGRSKGWQEGYQEGHAQGTLDASPYIHFRPEPDPRNAATPAAAREVTDGGTGPS